MFPTISGCQMCMMTFLKWNDMSWSVQSITENYEIWTIFKVCTQENTLHTTPHHVIVNQLDAYNNVCAEYLDKENASGWPWLKL